MSQKKDDWVTVRIPRDLAETVDEIIKVQRLGYRSRNDFITDAVRRRVEEIKKQLAIS